MERNLGSAVLRVASSSPLRTVIDLHTSRMRALTGERANLAARLRRERVAVLPGFERHLHRVREFFDRYYVSPRRRVAWVGINPGRLGGGKTGLPFLDGAAVAALLGEGDGTRERSARFLWSVISGFGPRAFFERVYLTNLSWLGFARDGRNVNLDSLPSPVQEWMIGGFVEEMRLVRPALIVPLGRTVEEALAALTARGQLEAPLGLRLPHPRHAAFPSRREAALRQYRRAALRHG